MNTQNRLPLIGLLLVQLAIGYEWANSGLTKIVHGGFPSGLAGELRDKSQGAASWYTSVLDSVVIPHGTGWGYTIEIGELVTGLALIAGALVWLLAWERIRGNQREAVLLLVAGASVVGVLMNISFHLANGAPHPWLIPKSGSDEGVDVDSLMPFIQLVFAVISLKMWAVLRREHLQAAMTGDLEGAASRERHALRSPYTPPPNIDHDRAHHGHEEVNI